MPLILSSREPIICVLISEVVTSKTTPESATASTSHSAVRAAVARVAVVEVGVTVEFVVTEAVDAPAGAHHGDLGGAEVPLGHVGRGRSPVSFVAAQGGSPVRLGRTVP